MIDTAQEFLDLRCSRKQEDYLRAASDYAPSHVWLEIITNHPEMRSWVAQNKTVPVEILDSLSMDANPAVRIAVAMKNKLPLRLFDVLADDEESAVRERLAFNKNTPVEVLQRLVKDTSEPVAHQARERLRLLGIAS